MFQFVISSSSRLPSFCSSQKPYHVSTKCALQRSLSTATAVNIDQQKHPTRGGQNLTIRYRRLEKSLRGKEKLTKVIDDMPQSSSTVFRGQDLQPGSSPRNSAKIFRGFRIPDEPQPPGLDGKKVCSSSVPPFFKIITKNSIIIYTECCMSGCAICVHDLYQDSIEAYDQAIETLRSSLSSLHIPESDWPVNIRPSSDHRTRRTNVSLDAFQEMERMLRIKQGR